LFVEKIDKAYSKEGVFKNPLLNKKFLVSFMLETISVDQFTKQFDKLSE